MNGAEMTNRLYFGVAEESSKGRTDSSFMEYTSSALGRRLSLGSRRHGGFI